MFDVLCHSWRRDRLVLNFYFEFHQIFQFLTKLISFEQTDVGWPSANNVKGTFWAEQSDPGGCQMPEGNYRIVDAVALGFQPELGSLAFKPGLCGKVLDIDCGHGNVQAVVVSTCGGNSCGVDMIGRTWRKATNNQSPGIVQCKVSLTDVNPLNEHSMVCYHRPNSDISNLYFTIVGVINTNGRVATSATLAGIQGSRENDACFTFNAQGKPLFNNGADAVFRFEDGGTVQFRLGDCRKSGGTHIFR